MSSVRHTLGSSAVALAASVSAFACLGACKTPSVERSEIRVAAAADLTLALGILAPAFEKKTGEKVVVSFGASGALAEQIAHGAPFDLFAAADRGPVDSAVKSGACISGTERPYALGQIVLIARDGLPLPTSLDALATDSFKRIAIANPDHAPYGRAAKEALIASHLMDRVQSKLVFGSNVQQTLEFVRTGNADAAIVARSLMKKNDSFAPIDRALHSPLAQTLVECGGGHARDKGHAFSEFLLSEEARSVLRESGFEIPGTH